MALTALLFCCLAVLLGMALGVRPAAADEVGEDMAQGGEPSATTLDIGAESVSVPSEQAASLEEALGTLADGGTISLNEDIQLDTLAIDGKHVTITASSGATISKAKGSESPNLFALANGGSLTLEHVTVDGSGNTGGRTIVATGGSKVVLGEDATLTGNTSYGAVYLDASTLELAGGSISGNTAALGQPGTREYEPSGTWTNVSTRYVYDASKEGSQPLGGAVLMVAGSRLTLASGTISENSALCGGAIYSYGSCNLAFEAGEVIGNKVGVEENPGGTGGAVCIDGDGSGDGHVDVAIEGTSFSANGARQGGVFYFGIDTAPLDFSMTAGTMSKNTSTDGSVLYSLAADGVIGIRGEHSVVSENVATGDGAIYQGMYPGNARSERAAIRIGDGATFTGNQAKRGSCIYATRDGGIKSLELDGAVFENNQSSGDGGVMRYGVPESTLSVVHSTFRNNSSENHGGCFYLASDAKYCEFTLDNSTFTGNSAAQQGGVVRGFPPYGDFTFKNCTFNENIAKEGDGGCFYFPGDGTDSNLTIDGGTYEKNTSGGSGGVFRANLNGGNVTIEGDALFEGNSANINAGAFSIRRKNEESYGTAHIVACRVIGNVCNAEYANYQAADRASTEHYNTGGIYIGENITAYMNNAEITKNYVEDGFNGDVVGAGIGICPHGTLELYPENGATIHDNGNGKGMDILAVPWDEVIDHEVPSQLYICDETPDGEAYNWTDLNGENARTGYYSWDQALKEKEDSESGVSTMSLASANEGYAGETTLDPVGFKAHISEPGGVIAPILRLFGLNNNEPKVYIAGNGSKAAEFGGGGVMVNGTVISGELEISVEKVAEYLSESNKEFTFQLGIVGYDSENPIEVSYTKSSSGETGSSQESTATFTKNTDFYPEETSMVTEFTLKANEKITFKLNNKFTFTSGTDYGIYLKETDDGGAENTKITYKVYGEDNQEITGNLTNEGIDKSLGTGAVKAIRFTCTNTFTPPPPPPPPNPYGNLSVRKAVDPADAGEGMTFPFTATFGNGSYNSAISYTITGEGEITSAATSTSTIVTPEQGVVGFELAPGSTITFRNLPQGTPYEVFEDLEGEEFEEWIGPKWLKNPGTSTEDNPIGGTIYGEGMTTSLVATNTLGGNHKLEVDPGDGANVVVGQDILYRIHYQNTTSETATVTIKDPIDRGLTFKSATSGGTISSEYVEGEALPEGCVLKDYYDSSGVVTWTITDVAPGQGGYVELICTVNENATGSLIVKDQAFTQVGNGAWVALEEPTNPLGKPGKEQTTPGDGEAAIVGDTITYEIAWTNYLGEPANVTIADPLDVGLDFVSASDGGEWMPNAAPPAGMQVGYDYHGCVVWNLGEQPAGASGVVTLTCQVNANAMIANSVSDQAFVGVNNVFQATTAPTNPYGGPHKAEVDPGDGKGVEVGQEITYEIQYQNTTDAVADVTIVDPLDIGLDFVSATDGGTYDESGTLPDACSVDYLWRGVVSWTIPQVPAGASGKVSLTVRVNDAATEAMIVKDQAFVQVANGAWQPTEEPVNPLTPVTPPEPETPSGPETPTGPGTPSGTPGTAVPQTNDPTPLGLAAILAALGVALLATACVLLRRGRART